MACLYESRSFEIIFERNSSVRPLMKVYIMSKSDWAFEGMSRFNLSNSFTYVCSWVGFHFE